MSFGEDCNGESSDLSQSPLSLWSYVSAPSNLERDFVAELNLTLDNRVRGLWGSGADETDRAAGVGSCGKELDVRGGRWVSAWGKPSKLER